MSAMINLFHSVPHLVDRKTKFFFECGVEQSVSSARLTQKFFPLATEKNVFQLIVYGPCAASARRISAFAFFDRL